MSDRKKSSRVLVSALGALLLAAVCGGIIYFSVYQDRFFPFCSGLLHTLWWTCKVSCAGVLLCSAFFLFHPLLFQLKVRGTPSGQRGHLRFSHLFGFFWIDGSGSIHGQEVRLGIWRWSWRIAGHLRERPSRKSETGSPPQKPDLPTPKETASGASQAPEPRKAEQPPAMTAQPVSPARTERDVHPDPAGTEKGIASRSTETPAATGDGSPAAVPGPEPMKPASGESKKAPPPEEPAEQPPSISQTIESTAHEKPSPFEPATELPGKGPQQEPSRDKPFFEKLRGDIRRFRRRAIDGWHKLRIWINLARRVWRRASPMLRRLGTDLWQGMHLRPSLCRVRYGMPEAHLTGLTQGLAAPFAGLLRPFSVHFEPVPVFTGTTLSVYVDAGVRIQPWRVLWAWIVLLTTWDFWKALRDAWQWHKRRSESSTP